MSEVKDDEYWMQLALKYADKAEAENEIPVGAVVVKEGKMIAAGWNRSITCMMLLHMLKWWLFEKQVKSSKTTDLLIVRYT